MNYQTFKPVTTSRQTKEQKPSNKNNFSDHNYNFLQYSKSQNPLYEQSKSNRSTKELIETYHKNPLTWYILTKNHELQ